MIHPKRMVIGINQNIHYKGHTYHIQTEDSGLGNPLVVTHLFLGGNVLACKTTDYTEISDSDNLSNAVCKIMEEQHQTVLRNLINGVYDVEPHTQPIKTKPRQSDQRRPASNGTAEFVLPASKRMAIEKAAFEQVEELRGIEGLTGAAVYTPKGTLLAMLTDEGQHFMEAGPLANNVLTAAEQASLEMMDTEAGRCRQLHIETENAHIFVRCFHEGSDTLESTPGKIHIHVVLLIRSDSNVGLVRMRMESLVTKLAEGSRAA